jgi:hypothetical protein
MRLPKQNKELLNIQLASISNESPYSDRKVALFFIHDFDFNSNGLRIPEELCSANNPKTNKPFYDSLNGAPIVAALKGDDLGGHEPEFDEDGNIIRLNTEGIGTLFNTHIGTYQINNEDKYGLWAEGFLWLRFSNTLNVVEELFTENGRVDTSCEVSLGGFEFSEEGRTAIKSILYFGHCLLGSTKTGAYADSGMYEFNLQVAEAYKKDVKQTNSGINSSLDINIQNGGVRMLSHEEIKEQLRSLLNPNDNSESGWVVNYYTWDMVVFDSFCVAREYDTGKLYRFDYEVNDGATVTLVGERKQQMIQYVDVPEGEDVEISELFIKFKENEAKIKELNSELEQEKIKLNSFTEEKTQLEIKTQELSTKEEELNQLKTQIEELQAQLNTKDEALKLTENDKNEAIIKLNTAMEDLKTQIASLQPIKEKWETDQEQKRIAELNQKKEDLKQYVINSKVFTAEELENENIKQMIEELNESGVKALIADKIVDKAKVELNEIKENKTDDVTILINDKGKDLIPGTILSKYGIK